jgi:hypothetical protein
METLTIKQEFHKLIDEIPSEQHLCDLFESVAIFAKQKTDVLDDLSAFELSRLDESLEQIILGRVVSDTVMREKYNQWLTK